MSSGVLQGIGTILAMTAFISICVWAYSAKNKKSFEEAAQLPFLDEEQGKKNHERFLELLDNLFHITGAIR